MWRLKYFMGLSALFPLVAENLEPNIEMVPPQTGKGLDSQVAHIGEEPLMILIRFYMKMKNL